MAAKSDNMKPIMVMIGILAFFALAIMLGNVLIPRYHIFYLPAIQYHAGTGNEALTRTATVRVEGYLRTTLLGSRSFEGAVDVEGAQPPVPDGENMLELSFGSNNYATMSYLDPEDGLVYSYGTMYIDLDLSRIVITVYDPVPGEPATDEWDSDNDLIIAAPATNRAEALEISELLMSGMFD